MCGGDAKYRLFTNLADGTPFSGQRRGRGLAEVLADAAVERVLIYRLGSLGDTVVALPALRLVGRAFPKARRVMLTNFSVGAKAAPMAEVLDDTGLVDGYIEYPLGLRRLAAVFALWRHIRRWRPDVVVYLAAPRGGLKVFRDAMFFRLCGARRVVGVPYRRDQRRRLPRGDGTYEYEGARLLRCLRALGTQDLDDPESFALALGPAVRRPAAALEGGAPMVAVSVGAKAEVKDWGDENWRALLAGMAAMLPGWRLLLLGAAVERDRCAALAVGWPGDAVNLCGTLSVRESAAVLSGAKIFIGHDSGPMHLAAAVGTTCVAIFSARNLPGEWFPHGAAHKVLYREMPCQGCGLSSCVALAKACIASITVAEVLAAVQAVIEAGTSQL